MDPDSLQTPTGTGTRLHVTATIVGHKTGPGNTLEYARLRTIFVVGVERRGTFIHCAEVLGHPYTCYRDKTTGIQVSTMSGDSARLQPKSRDCTVLHTIFHVKGRVTTDAMQQPQDCTSLQTGC